MTVQQKRQSVRRRGQWWLIIGAASLALAAVVMLNLPRGGRHISVHVDGQEHRLTSTRAATVGLALAEAGIVVGPQDRVSPPLSSPLSSSTIVSIVRVSTSEQTRRVVIPYPRLISENPGAAQGYRQIVQMGVPGIKEVREQITTEDGVEVARQVVAEHLIVEPVAEHVIVGTRVDLALDAFRESALGYLGRGGVTRLSPSVVEQTLFELARLRGDRYGLVRVLALAGRPWLVLQTFARSPEDVTLFVFWWTDELHAFGQVISEGMHLLDGRAEKTDNGIELGLVVTPGQGVETLAPQYMLLRLPVDVVTREQHDTWRLIWSSRGRAEWLSNQGSVAFIDNGLQSLDVRGASFASDASAVIVECRGCPHRRFESVWQRQGDTYMVVSQRSIPSPYATLWSFMDNLSSGRLTATLSLVSDSTVISSGLKAGLGRPDLRWTTTGKETDTMFDLRSKESAVRVTLRPQGQGWVVVGIGPVPAQGRIIFTGTRPVVRGIFAMDTTGTAPPHALGDGQRYVWSPDYARLAYEWQGQVYIVDSDGSHQRLVTSGAAPAWSLNGKYLALERTGDKGPQIVVVDLDSGQENVLAAGSRPSWRPTDDGASLQLAYTHRSNQSQPPMVYLSNVLSGATSVLASDGSEPLWSPDGTAVAFLTMRQEIAVVMLTPGRVYPVGKGWGYIWSPDGRYLAFIRSKPAGTPLVWDKETGEVKSLIERNDVDGLSWSPDGRELVFSLTSGGGLWLAGSDGSNLRKLGDGRDPIWAWLPRAGR